MSLVDGEEGDFQLAQNLDGLFLGEGFGSHVEQLGTAAEEVFFHLVLLHA